VEGQGCGRRVILDKDVFNDANENIGTDEDLIVTRDTCIFVAIIGVGGFLGMDATMSPSVSIIAKSQTSASCFLVQAKKRSKWRRIQICRRTVLSFGAIMPLQA